MYVRNKEDTGQVYSQASDDIKIQGFDTDNTNAKLGPFLIQLNPVHLQNY